MGNFSTSCQKSATDGDDIPQWLSLLIVLSVSSSVFLGLAINCNPYLTSETGYADGGDMYSHQIEILYLKEILQSGATDFWFDEVTLGYPLFLAYSPFPCLVTSITMILTESFISPLLLFRWMYLAILSAMPWTWFVGLRKLGLTRLESSLVSLCVYSISSWRKFGLELEAFQYYGLFTQTYGMAIFPMAVGFLYEYIIYGLGSRNTTVLLVVLNFTAHAFFGIYLGIVTGVTLVVELFTNPLPLAKKLRSPSISRACSVHFITVALLSWWIIPVLANYEYMGGLPWKRDSENGYKAGFVLRKLFSGETFDHGRKFPFVTVGVVAGLACVCFTWRKSNRNTLCYCAKRRMILTWLGVLFCATFLLFLGRTFSGPFFDLIPFHEEIEATRYLNGIHFCGLLLMGVSFSCFLRFLCATLCRVSKGFFKCRVVLIATMLVITPVFLSSRLQKINNLLSVTEIQDLPESLNELKSHPSDARILAKKVLGTGDPLTLALLPHYSRKPGILTYSRGYHDSLSLYYLEVFQFSLETIPWSPDLLRLYNIRFLATSGIALPPHFLKACQLRHLAFVGDMEVFVRTFQENYGYFEFVHVPGAVVGDLKGMREAVSISTQLFTKRAVFAVNPLSAFNNPSFKIVVSNKNSGGNLLSFLAAEEFEIKWFVTNRQVKEKAFLEDAKFRLHPGGVSSRVMQEEVGRNFYEAYVHVVERAWSENFYKTEHLLLKVTYHPYWKCVFQSLADATDSTRDWLEVPVHHVTPNLMSVVLPPGKHHVICQYKNPIYQKVGFILFLVIYITLILKEVKFFFCFFEKNILIWLLSQLKMRKKVTHKKQLIKQ